MAGLSYGYALAGRKDEAIRLLRELEEGYKRPFVRFPTGVPAYRVAAIYMALGDKDRALEWLEKDRGGWMVWLEVDPVFDGLHSDLRFQDLLRRIQSANDLCRPRMIDRTRADST